MAKSISELKSALRQFGVLPTNNFNLSIFNKYGSMYNNNDWSDWVVSFTIPPYEFSVNSAKGGGLARNVPSNVSFDTFEIVFRSDEQMQGYNYFRGWMENIITIGRQAGGLADSARIGFYEDYAESSVIILTINNSNSDPIAQFNFQEVYPSSLGEISLDSTQETELLTYSVKFNFRYYNRVV
jgi:hypothetical protein